MSKSEFRAEVQRITGQKYRSIRMIIAPVRVYGDQLITSRGDVSIYRSTRDGSFYRFRWTD